MTLAVDHIGAAVAAETDFANQLHTYGIYGQRDYNAWLGKIACDRLGRGLDRDAYASTTALVRKLSTAGSAVLFVNTGTATVLM